MKRKQLYELARDKPEFKGTPVVETIAARYGFEINWLSPYPATLNPRGITKGYVAGHNNGKGFDAVYGLIFEGFEKVTKAIWAGLVRRADANEDDFIEQFHILTEKDINDMIIDLDTDSDNEIDNHSLTTELEEVTLRTS